MADNDQERTEEPTAKRLQDARRKGQVARSRELNTWLVLLTSVGALVVFGRWFMEGLAAILDAGLRLERAQIFDPEAGLRLLAETVIAGLWLVAPILLVSLIAGLGASVALGGWSFSTEALAPKPDRFNPIKGLGRMFSLRSLVELAKTLAKFLLLAGIAIGLMWTLRWEILNLGMEGLGPGLAHAGWILAWSAVVLSAALGLIAAIDVPWQLWDHSRQLKMSFQEVRDEMKETEGRPEVKGRIRQMQRELAQRRMMEEVPKADVVITNPTHFAVALRYDAQRMRAPRVVAKGRDQIAGRIRELASEHHVVLFEAPPLARALYFNCELEAEVPARLYVAVAQVLAYVYQLKTAPRHQRPRRPPDFDIPEEMQHPQQEGSEPVDEMDDQDPGRPLH